MKTALVILTYNDGELSSKLAVKVKDHKAFDHIILVNNQSTDNTPELIAEAAKQAPEKIKVINAPENGGYAKGNNFGIRYAIEHFGAELIFVANPDTYFTDQAASAMALEMERHPEYGLVAPVVNQGYNAWNLPTYAGMLESLFLIIFNLHKKLIRTRLLTSKRTICPVGVVEGSFFAISAKAYETIGGMDERTFMYGEEIMMSYRLMLNDLKVGILPKERYDHLHSTTMKKLNQNSKARAFHHFHDSFRVYNKYYLHTGPLQDLIFEACYWLAYLERVIYDKIKS
ncbi:MAG: glycosyltransferase family 2 protein [Lachnospiraceae bacterium]|nr:glycosyltransferase family 2 protein [Lachnospiraceae bacterium]